MPRFTKITSSIGPSCETERVLKQMILAGVNVCRLNFSHDTGETQGHKIDLIRKISDALNMPVGIMIDLQGPKHRIGNFATEEKYQIKPGQIFTFDSNDTPGDATRVYLPVADASPSV